MYQVFPHVTHILEFWGVGIEVCHQGGGVGVDMQQALGEQV